MNRQNGCKMIKPECIKCGKELKDFGAILLSPPDKKDKVKKYHLCKICYKEVEKLFDTKEGE